MRLTATFLALAAAISGVTADSITITICNGANYEGTCITPSIGIQHDCYSLKDDANGSIQGNVRSVKIPDGYRCRFWTSYSCNGGSTGDIQAPGQGSTSPPSMGSVKCYQN
ncbi:unnamed protein product [Penicillium salamii]|nr:unnamed protein product [Penicillium salamii]